MTSLASFHDNFTNPTMHRISLKPGMPKQRHRELRCDKRKRKCMHSSAQIARMALCAYSSEYRHPFQTKPYQSFQFKPYHRSSPNQATVPIQTLPVIPVQTLPGQI